MALNPTAKPGGFHRGVGDASNSPVLELVLAGEATETYPRALHICQGDDAGTDWNLAAVANPTVYIHSSAVTPVTDYLRIGAHDGTTAHIDLVGGTVLQFSQDGTGTWQISGGDLLGANGQGVVVGYTAQETVSTGDGATDLIPEVQVLGTAMADASLLIGLWSATDALGPMLGFVKSGNAAIGSHTIVADNEYVGRIVAFGDDGTDIETPVAEIRFVVDDAGGPGASAIGGSIEIFTTADGGTTLTKAVTIDTAQDVHLNTDSLTQLYFGAGDDATLGHDGTSLDLSFPQTTDEFVINETGANTDFRVEGDTDSDLLHVDAGLEVVAIGKAIFGAAAAAVTNGDALFTAGLALGTDVAASQVDDATHGTASTTIYIGNATITTSSDVRVKTEVAPWEGSALDLLRQARLYEFRYNLPGGGPQDSGYGPNARGKYIGMTAQDTIAWAPWIINAGPAKDCPTCMSGLPCDEHPYAWTVQYEHLVPTLVKAVQELEARIAALTN